MALWEAIVDRQAEPRPVETVHVYSTDRICFLIAGFLVLCRSPVLATEQRGAVESSLFICVRSVC